MWGPGARAAQRRVAALLAEAGMRVLPRQRLDEAACVVVLGGDRGVRSYLRSQRGAAPVLGLAEGEEAGFLAQADVRQLPSYLSKLSRGDYLVEEVPRLAVRIDGRDAFPVLNDVAVFPSRSATLMEHTLTVGGEEVWHDNGDGVIISTPIGSSAYSMSAGGPVIYPGSAAFGIISVNSLDVTRRPLVVPDSATVRISEVSASMRCEAVLDGTDRHRVVSAVECSRFPEPARLVRLGRGSSAVSALAKKVHLAGDLLRMPPSSKLLLKTLEYEGPMTQRQLAARTLLPARTVRMALSNLASRGYVSRRVSPRDARQKIYAISGR